MFKQCLRYILNKIPLQKKLIFESSPNFACNTYPVYLKLREQHPEYQMIWAVRSDSSSLKHGADGIIHPSSQSLFQRIVTAYHLYTCEGIISSNLFIEKKNERQFSLFLGHGSKTKRTKSFYRPGEKNDFIQVQSHFFDEVTMEEYACRRDQLVYLGYPRCDCFFDQTGEIEPPALDRYLIWLPTVRKRSMGTAVEIQETHYGEIGMPLVYTLDQLTEFNGFLRENKVKILFKPHPIQDISALKARSLSNIQILTDAEMEEKGIQLYELIAGSSALITDYSSVFFDYLLLNRPIATTTDDIESWKGNRGFAFDLESLYDRSTERVSTLAELKVFIQNVLEGHDDKANARKEICEMTNLYRDGKSTQRTVDFIMKTIQNKRAAR